MTTFPYCDNICQPADAEAAPAAPVQSETRVRFHYTGLDALPPEDYVDLDQRQTLSDRSDLKGSNLIDLAFGLHVPSRDASETAKTQALHRSWHGWSRTSC